MSSAADQLASLAQDFRNFHDAEYEAQKKAIRQVWSLPIKTRVRKGSAIAGVKLILPTAEGKAKEQLKEILANRNIEPTDERIGNFLRFALELNNSALVEIGVNLSNFKAGSFVLLHRGNPFDEKNAYSLEITRESGKNLTLEAYSGRNPLALAPSSGWVLDADTPDMRQILRKAIDRLPLASTAGALADIFLYHQPPTFDKNRRVEAEQLAQKIDFNLRQRKAFVDAFAAINYYLIQGPPGTGKTWVLAHLAVALARNGERVLITSSNHRGINNALRKIHDTTGYPHVVKVGKKSSTDDLGPVPNKESCPSLEPIAGEGIIVGATSFALYTQRLQGKNFDVIIADEASQLTLLQAAAVMLAGTKYIFIGDHQQMPPIIVADHNDPALKKSIFEYLFAFAPGTRLNTTYRLNAGLAQFPSQRFYDGDLKAHKSAASRRLHLPVSPTKYSDVLNPAEPSVFVDLAHLNTETSEHSEAHYIADMVSELLNCGTPHHEIAVVAPFRAQCREIRMQLSQRCSHIAPDDLAKITVDTVERMQGQERDVIFLSLTIGQFDSSLQRASFFFKPNRLNVAITRARVKRIIIGSSNLTGADFASVELKQWAGTFKDFLDSCHRIIRLKPVKKRPVSTARTATTMPIKPS